MKSLNSDQKRKVREFISITEGRCSESSAIQCLRQYNWNQDMAMDEYFANPKSFEDNPKHSQTKAVTAGGSSKGPDRRSIEALFQIYADPNNPEKTNLDGATLLYSHLGIEPLSLQDIVLLYKFNVLIGNGEYDKKSFVDGCVQMNVDSIENLSKKINEISAETGRNKVLFKQVYDHAYFLARDTTTQKNISKDNAKVLWSILLQNRFGLLDVFFEFLDSYGSKPIIKDTWTQFLVFVDKGYTLSSFKKDDWDDVGCWPVMIDDFVDWIRSNKL